MIKKRRGRRAYDSPMRRRRAEATRARLLRAARRLFASRGYGATTIPAIARAARVSDQTFYAVFGSKRGVLFALHASVLADADRARLDLELRRGDEPAAQLRAIVAFVVRFHSHAADLVHIVRAAGTADCDAADLWREGEGRRLKAQRSIVRAWSVRGALAPGVGEPEALAILWAFTGADSYRLFVEERGWTPAQFERWLADALSRLVLAPHAET